MTIINGITFRVEGTGGGCEALVAYVEGGTIVMTDGNLGIDFGAYVAEGYAAVDAGWYPGETWDNSEGPTHDVEGDSVEAAVEALLAKVSGK